MQSFVSKSKGILFASSLVTWCTALKSRRDPWGRGKGSCNKNGMRGVMALRLTPNRGVFLEALPSLLCRVIG